MTSFEEDVMEEKPSKGKLVGKKKIVKSSSPSSIGSFNKRIKATAQLASTIQEEVSQVVLGKEDTIEIQTTLSATIYTQTLMAKTFAQTLGCEFKRIQFTPDLLPADITGSYFYDPEKNKFIFRKGPLFCNILLADEINRAPPKTQAALLEAMEEEQITIEGKTHTLDKPFIVLATQNPIEYEGTYPLPEAQMDRFLVKLSVGYPDEDVETTVIGNRATRKKDNFDVSPRATPDNVIGMHESIEEVEVDSRILRYMVEIVQQTREDPRVLVGSSPRGSLGLLKLSRALALLSGRDYVIPDDVKRAVIPVLSHRIILKPEAKFRGTQSDQVLEEIKNTIAVPAVTPD